MRVRASAGASGWQKCTHNTLTYLILALHAKPKDLRPTQKAIQHRRISGDWFLNDNTEDPKYENHSIGN